MTIAIAHPEHENGAIHRKGQHMYSFWAPGKPHVVGPPYDNLEQLTGYPLGREELTVGPERAVYLRFPPCVDLPPKANRLLDFLADRSVVNRRLNAQIARKLRRHPRVNLLQLLGHHMPS
jgi:hypothetical protein